MAVASLDNWTGSQADTSNVSNDPLVEQINIIKGYLKQARDAMRFEEVRDDILHFYSYSFAMYEMIQ